MSTTKIPKVLITGATGKVGSATLEFLLSNKSIEIVAAVRTKEKAAAFTAKGIKSVILDFDDKSTHKTALEGIDRLFMVTGYTVDMLRQSKVLLDAAKKQGVQHVVHLGACGPDDASIGHWVWHQLVERYIEWSGFTFTHLRPQDFMQNLIGYGGEKVVKNGILNHYVAQAKLSWVDLEDVAEVAALALLHPEKHGGKTYRLGSDAQNFDAIAALMTSVVGKPFRYEALSPEIFKKSIESAGAEMAYMNCVYDHWKQYAAGTIPNADATFDTFYEITGKQPTMWKAFIEKNKTAFDY